MSSRQLNQATFQRLKTNIKESYPSGRFVAIAEGQIVADAADFQGLCTLLKAQGKNPTQTLIVQAGVEYPEKAVILLNRKCGFVLDSRITTAPE